jgi:phosphohistidine phosphatase
VTLYLVHHGDAVGPDVDPRRPLSEQGRVDVARLADEAAARNAHPAIVWHSGKLRARQTAEAFWRACNALAPMAATRDLQPDDPPEWILNRIRSEARDVLIAGHFPHLPGLLALITSGEGAPAAFPLHGVVALATEDGGKTWSERWRLETRNRTQGSGLKA